MKVFANKSKALRAVLWGQLLFCWLCPRVAAQEVLLPLQSLPQEKAVAGPKATGFVALPFFDDFSHYPQGGACSPLRWEERGGARMDDGARLMAPTVGVATLDAIDARGELYPHAATSMFPADTLTSLPIGLGGLTAADSVVFSFYYLPGGGEGNLWERVGDAPDGQDSLVLEFYRPADSLWTLVWSRGGVEVDSLVAATGVHWQYVAIPIEDSAYFDSLFQFRFRNYCSLTETAKPGLAGNCDYWHLDYIVLDTQRTAAAVPVFRDVAFSENAPSALADYRAMPARQYRASEMAAAFDMKIVNLFNSDLASQYTYAVLDAAGDTLYQYDGGYENAPAFLPLETYQSSAGHATPPVQFSFPVGSQEATYMVVHTVREGVGGDTHRDNDTVRFEQVFADYYAYDDGTAENGYGLTSTASHLYLAYRFDLNEEDTLTALDLYFSRTLDGGNEQVPFFITVWQAEGGRPGTVLYRDKDRRYPLFDGMNRYQRYVLEEPVVVSGDVFVGFEQTNNYYINLGFDRSKNTADRIYYLTSTEWQQSILSGSLMMRPHFGVAATVGIAGIENTGREIEVYPNPARERVTIKGLPEGSRVEVYDAMGRKVMESWTAEVDAGHLAQGIYLLRCTAPDGFVHTEKLIIRH